MTDHDDLLTVLEADFDDVDLAAFDGGEPPPCPAPDDVDQATRYLATLRHLKGRMLEVEATALAEVRRIAGWEERASAPLLRRYEWVERALNGWALAMNADDPTRRTISLPNGDVEVRPRQPRIEVTADRETLERLRQEHPGWVRDKLEPNKRDLLAAVKPGNVADDLLAVPEGYEAREAVNDDGEVVPGVFVLVPVSKSVRVVLAGEAT